MQNFMLQVQRPLSQKEKTFSGFFIAFLKCAWNIKDFEKKDENPSLIISEIIESEESGYLNVYKVLLENTIRESTCWRVRNTAEISTAPLLTYFPTNSSLIELEKVCFS